MSSQETIFTIIVEDECPHYSVGDEFDFANNAILLPSEKPACLILFKDLIDFIETNQSLEISNKEYEFSTAQFNCSGCSGSVRLEYKKEAASGDLIKQDKVIGNIARLLSKFSVFQSLDKDDITELVTFLRLSEYAKDDIVIKQGEPGKHLYIITSGKVNVSDGEKTIACLEKGEVFGEMSLLSGDAVSATVTALETTKVLRLNRKDARRILHKFPSIKLFLAGLITQRLSLPEKS